MLRNTVVSSNCVLKIIRQLKSLNFKINIITFKRIQPVLFPNRICRRKTRKYQRNFHLVIRLKLDNLPIKEVSLFFSMGQVLMNWS